jgi:hypothetical protein
LSSGPAGANEKGTVWRDRKARLLNCIVQKKRVMSSRDVWEQDYTDFKACEGMPARGSKEYNWRQNQLSNGPAGLGANIKKEIEANEGGTVWRDRKARLLNCVAQKNRVCNAQQRRAG